MEKTNFSWSIGYDNGCISFCSVNFAWYSKSAEAAPKLKIGKGKEMRNAKIYIAQQTDVNDVNGTAVKDADGVSYKSNKVTATAMASGCVIFYLLVERFLKNKKDMIVITAVLTAITAIFTYCPYLLPWSLDTASAVALFMLMGAKLGQIQYFGDENKKQFNIIVVCLATLVYGLVTQVAEPINMSIREFGYDGILGAFWFLAAASAGVLIFLWLCRYIEKFRWTRIFILIGKHTYSIMALHILLFKYLTKVYYIFNMQFEFNRGCIWYWVYWTILFAVVIVICVAFDYVLDLLFKKRR